MKHPKIDGVIETVRYTPDGTISMVRIYQRHNQVWSDNVLLGREELSGLLKKGQRIVTGTRKTSLGSVFETRSEVHFTNDHIVTEGQAAGRDLLAGVPVF
jgi:hypothetical protein